MFIIKSKKQKEQIIIKQIHDEFDTAQEKLLLNANNFLKSIQVEQVDDKLINLSDRFTKIGFKNIPIVKKVEKIEERNRKQNKQFEKIKEQAELIEYYKLNYPLLKFITEDELNKICNKYNLVYASVSKYLKDVPEKNLIEVEQAQKLASKDEPQNRKYVKILNFYDWKEVKKLLYGKNIKCDHDDFHVINYIEDELIKLGYNGNLPYFKKRDLEFTTYYTNGLFICAPQSHFNLNNLKKKGFGFFEFMVTKPNDPIIFRYVRGGVQILSKWGIEANDSILVNEINN